MFDSPLGVSVVNNVELALSKGVPELDGSVSGSRDDLSVVGREGDAEDVTGVSDELSGGQSGVQVPESEGLVPRGREGELAVRGDRDVRDEVVVSVEDLLGETEGVLVSGKLPNDDSLVYKECQFPVSFSPPFSTAPGKRPPRLTSGGSEDHVRVLRRGGDGGDPARVAGESALECERISHFLRFVRKKREERGRRAGRGGNDGMR